MDKARSQQFYGVDINNDVLMRLCAALPQLPSVLRYYDEFDDIVRSIRNPEDQARFELFLNGTRTHLDFAHNGNECSFIYKHVFAFILAQNISIVTLANRLSAARYLTPTDVAALVDAGPARIGLVWKAMRARTFPTSTYIASKYVLQLLCAHRLNGWSNDYLAYLTTALPLPAEYKYAGVRSGDVFLSADEEALVVRHLDQIAGQLTQENAIRPRPKDLANAGMLLCAYQFAMRPIQIAMLDVRHVRIWNDEVSGYPTIHLTFHMAKQRGSKKEWL